jgi:hypothetical protein
VVRCRQQVLLLSRRQQTVSQAEYGQLTFSWLFSFVGLKPAFVVYKRHGLRRENSPFEKRTRQSGEQIRADPWFSPILISVISENQR